MHNLGILLSGRGSNFEAIALNVAAGKIPDARIAVVISNKPDAGGIEAARRHGTESVVIPSKGKPREEHDREVVGVLKEHKVDLVCLAGYMRLLSPWFVRQFPRRILNIHPSLLPAFPGLEAQEQAFAYGVKVSGCTVHFVDEELDHGADHRAEGGAGARHRRRANPGGANSGTGAHRVFRSDQNCARGKIRSCRQEAKVCTASY